MAHIVRKENDNGPEVVYFDRKDLAPIDPADTFASWMIPAKGQVLDLAGTVVSLTVSNPVIEDLTLTDGTVITDGQVKLDIEGFDAVALAADETFLEFALEVEILAADGRRETHPDAAPYIIVRINKNLGDQ